MSPQWEVCWGGWIGTTLHNSLVAFRRTIYHMSTILLQSWITRDVQCEHFDMHL